MSGLVGASIGAWERQLFTGREPELAAFREALDERSAPFRLFYVYGPGGIGKTALLREFGRICRDANVAHLYVDARYLAPSPDAVQAAIAEASAVEHEDAAEEPARRVITIDTFELLRPLRDWFRDRLIPSLPERTLLLIADHDPPPGDWRASPGLRPFMTPLPLRNFDPEESRTYFSRRDVDERHLSRALSATHGHPLALALIADLIDQQPDVDVSDEAIVDVVRAVVQRLLRAVPDLRHRRALEAAAMVRTLTEPLLGELLDETESGDLFDWLAGLSFVSADRFGVHPHDLARDAIAFELRWRNPERFAELHNRARHYYYRSFYATSGQAQQRALTDLIFLHRDNPVVRPFFDWQLNPSATVGEMHPGDVDALVGMVRRHEGEQSAGLAEFWLARRPESVLVFRGDGDEPLGFMLLLGLEDVSASERETDPAVASTLGFLERAAPTRPGEVATLFRFWMAADTYQSVSPIQSLVFINAVRHYLLTPGLAYTFFPCADPDFWAPVFAYADLTRLPEADFIMDGKRFGVYGHDWRVRPPVPWLSLLAEREVAEDFQPPPQSPPPLVVLSKPDFEAAVRAALRDLHRPGQLAGNALLRSRIVTDRVGLNAAPAERLSCLQAAIQESAEQLTGHPRSLRGYRALQHTYLQPAATQELAAELLDLPFSTYRRHLAQGIEALTQILWQLELGAER